MDGGDIYDPIPPNRTFPIAPERHVELCHRFEHEQKNINE
jgi:hypothetical protein